MRPVWNIRRLFSGACLCLLRCFCEGPRDSKMDNDRLGSVRLLPSRNRSLVLLAALFVGGLLLLLYVQPMSSVTIIQAGSSVYAEKHQLIIAHKQTHDRTNDDEIYGVQKHMLLPENNGNSVKSKSASNNLDRVEHLGRSSEEQSDMSSTRSCVKKWNVSFLKVHKAGSTTVMNIFLRFAIQNNLNIVLPSRSAGYGFNYLGYGKTVSRDRIVPLPGNQTYNILCNHVVYNKSAFRSILPDDTLYVGIIREPRSHFLSAGTYYGMFGRLQNYAKEHNLTSNSNIISDFLRAPSKYPVGTYYTHNKMSFDLGVPINKFTDTDFLNKYFSELNEDYTLMMVMERFEESLVLMRRALCWSTKDILYVPLNARHNKRDVKLSQADVNNLNDWNSADFRLYDYFVKIFDKLVLNAGPGFKEEVEHFKQTRNKVEQYCKLLLSKNSRQVPSVAEFAASQWDESFTIDITDCKLMTEDELSMMKRLIDDAWNKYNVWRENHA